MRKSIATVAAVIAVLVAFGGAAGTAAADDPGAWNYYSTSYSTPYSLSYSGGCQTPYKTGVFGQYGAWGYYIDGCTTVMLECPAKYSRCEVLDRSFIKTEYWRGDRVTMNSRVRVFGSAGQLLGWRDASCAGVDTCANNQLVYLNGGEKATIQCNGVRQATSNRASDLCSYRIRSL